MYLVNSGLLSVFIHQFDTYLQLADHTGGMAVDVTLFSAFCSEQLFTRPPIVASEAILAVCIFVDRSHCSAFFLISLLQPAEAQAVQQPDACSSRLYL